MRMRKRIRPGTGQALTTVAASCATLLGRTLPSGTLCTVPAPGAPPVADEDQCFGDAS
ncbi:hypothetical protein [Streptomyces sp. NPDC088246]|uniref:hypothetical protein n=1 Tax=Streptomyces sp. NPDC088246 TaxID=3365842 RepID=UPI0038305952